MTIYLEKFICPKLYQTWSDKTNSLTKSDGKGIRGNSGGIRVVKKLGGKSPNFLPKIIQFSKIIYY